MKSEQTVQGASQIMIVGGGPVGLLLSLGLARQGFSVQLLESQPPTQQKNTDTEKTENAFDGRVLALSFGSIEILQELGVWQALKPFATPIEHVHVSQKGFMGITTIDADEMNVNALGFSVQGRDLGQVLWQTVQEHKERIEVLAPAKLEDFTEDQDGIQAQVSIDGDVKSFKVQLLIGADGTDSQVRKSLGLPLQKKSYGAHAILAQIETAEHPRGWSYERFTTEGPVALLPMHGHFHKAVLVCPDEKLKDVMALDDQAYLRLFSEKMGDRLGGFVSVSKRLAYPLQETYVENFTRGRALLLGNAAHTQHPVAAQGLNLGIRDIAVFLGEVAKQGVGSTAVESISQPEFLQHYAELRQPDHKKVMGMTDSLIDIFQHKSALVGHLRGLGLMAMQALPGAKRRFSRFAMGKS